MARQIYRSKIYRSRVTIDRLFVDNKDAEEFIQKELTDKLSPLIMDELEKAEKIVVVLDEDRAFDKFTGMYIYQKTAYTEDIVRCKDCAKRGTFFCPMNWADTEDNGFCYWGACEDGKVVVTEQ